MAIYQIQKRYEKPAGNPLQSLSTLNFKYGGLSIVLLEQVKLAVRDYEKE